MADLSRTTIPIGLAASALTASQLLLVRQAVGLLAGVSLPDAQLARWLDDRRVVFYSTGGGAYRIVGRMQSGNYRLLCDVGLANATWKVEAGWRSGPDVVRPMPAA
jgi:hypothetical protein